jgi:hypothetical protein
VMTVRPFLFQGAQRPRFRRACPLDYRSTVAL